MIWQLCSNEGQLALFLVGVAMGFGLLAIVFIKELKLKNEGKAQKEKEVKI